ncbi:hypothetical protein Anapl_09694 [Anas platyrhynchos]|uniref:Uncharacterized protein n=1 Tax=Anas platyrhynchos TaxID=8839 RepID=R0KAL8_ANAPL|nr:hypothetical protein Anapl_09694 [Anas platyrhynchos]
MNKAFSTEDAWGGKALHVAYGPLPLTVAQCECVIRFSVQVDSMGTSLTQQTNILNAAVKKPVERAPKPDGAAAPGAVEGQNSPVCRIGQLPKTRTKHAAQDFCAQEEEDYCEEKVSTPGSPSTVTSKVGYLVNAQGVWISWSVTNEVQGNLESDISELISGQLSA